MQQYVLCYAQPKQFQWWPEVLLIEKKRPAWQNGKYNLPGGHVEEGESIHEAAARELFEETNITCLPENVRMLGTIEGDFGIVHVCRCEYDFYRGRNLPMTMTDEEIKWMPVEEAFRDPKLIGNLRVIIPLIRSNLIGWTLTETDEATSIVLCESQSH